MTAVCRRCFRCGPLQPGRCPCSMSSGNVIGYVPLGFLAALAGAHPGRGGCRAHSYWLGLLLILSFALEFVQLYLPTRTSSKLDQLANAGGGAARGAGRRSRGPGAALEDGLAAASARALHAPPWRRIELWARADRAVAAVAVNSETLLFGNRRPARAVPRTSGKLNPAEVFVRVGEAGVACGERSLPPGLPLLLPVLPGQPVAGARRRAGGRRASAVRLIRLGQLIGSQAVVDCGSTPGGLYGPPPLESRSSSSPPGFPASRANGARRAGASVRRR